MRQDIVQSVDRAFDILEALKDGEIGLVDLSKKVNLNKSTVHRLLNTLIYRGYVSQNQDNNKYRLTLKFLQIGNNFLNSLDIISIAKPYISKLSEKTNEVVHLVTIEEYEIVYIDKIESNNTIRMHSYIGKRIPIYCTAVGKAYMAYLKDSEFLTLWDTIKNNLIKHTENTIVSKTIMLKELENIRNNGFAIDYEENEKEVICIGAPIFNYDKSIKYAISISTPKMRIDKDKIEYFGRLIKETARNISKELGYIY
ncbi:IclR family transcriptional regulator [Paramaledivibacter caminithermalis]|jgi:DNA-binding IclR family transcriptional regulator|uniref:Glycerol operon regulatory protein n=1 Tax=Paramaledivibacter caminithermalis (strain DSM 15212 / CIP 107654 / DViRD3) TaxID=1121301 RepID=A0A1M6S7X0_PARC5|nr:IclR family transcriptional regulator [Paramaledivibacter caminithermalis]SHK40627.1 transcriptional regulator, IclR family [Paramaledivibacter caminithermalis DSM 15212]